VNEPEKLFVRFCQYQAWKFERIDESHRKRTADFCLKLEDGTGVVVEVKQFDPNKQERKEQQRLDDGRFVLTGSKPGKRLRSIIGKANAQIKALCRAEPGMLVVFNRTHNQQHDHLYSVKTAMYGIDVVSVHVPNDPRASPSFGPVRSGPCKKVGPERNTSVSCVAVLREYWPSSPERPRVPKYAMDVCHNRFALYPLDPSRLVGSSVRHYRLQAGQSDWELVPTAADRRGGGEVRNGRANLDSLLS